MAGIICIMSRCTHHEVVVLSNVLKHRHRLDLSVGILLDLVLELEHLPGVESFGFILVKALVNEDLKHWVYLSWILL